MLTSTIAGPEQVDVAEPVGIALEQVQHAFAFGSEATDLQREMLNKALVGSIVRWPVRVYEIGSTEDGRFKVVSEPPLSEDGSTFSLVHVYAVVTPRSDADRELIAATKTGGRLVIKGRVQEIMLRAAVVISPAIVETDQ